MSSAVSAGRSWVEVDLGALLRNLDVYSASLPPQMKVMAVVKADAYGHGDTVAAKKLFDHGIRHFAVSNIDEAIHIRNAGVEGQVLILGYTPVHRAEELVRHGITQALLSEEYAEQLSAAGYTGKCQFAIDTGMRRIGLNADDPAACERVIRKYAEKLRLDGLFTHLCVADTPEENAFTEKQIALFEEIVHRVSDLRLPYCHCMNSAGGLWHKSSVSCFARLGIILYGLKPDYMNTLPAGVEPVLSWKTVVSMVKDVKPGDTIGYGRSFTARQPMTVATVPTGYADGYSRLLSGKGWALVNGRKAPIVGRVCMDQMMLDVTGIPGVHMGSQAVLIGKSGNETITADDLAHLYGTIGYEVVCGISKRVDRIYLDPR